MRRKPGRNRPSRRKGACDRETRTSDAQIAHDAEASGRLRRNSAPAGTQGPLRPSKKSTKKGAGDAFGNPPNQFGPGQGARSTATETATVREASGDKTATIRVAIGFRSTEIEVVQIALLSPRERRLFSKKWTCVIPGRRGQPPFAGTARRVLRTNGDCPLFPPTRHDLPFASKRAAGRVAGRRAAGGRRSLG